MDCMYMDRRYASTEAALEVAYDDLRRNRNTRDEARRLYAICADDPSISGAEVSRRFERQQFWYLECLRQEKRIRNLRNGASA